MWRSILLLVLLSGEMPPLTGNEYLGCITREIKGERKLELSVYVKYPNGDIWMKKHSTHGGKTPRDAEYKAANACFEWIKTIYRKEVTSSRKGI